MGLRFLNVLNKKFSCKVRKCACRVNCVISQCNLWSLFSALSNSFQILMYFVWKYCVWLNVFVSAFMFVIWEVMMDFYSQDCKIDCPHTRLTICGKRDRVIIQPSKHSWHTLQNCQVTVSNVTRKVIQAEIWLISCSYTSPWYVITPISEMPGKLPSIFSWIFSLVCLPSPPILSKSSCDHTTFHE